MSHTHVLYLKPKETDANPDVMRLALISPESTHVTGKQAKFDTVTGPVVVDLAEFEQAIVMAA